MSNKYYNNGHYKTLELLKLLLQIAPESVSLSHRYRMNVDRQALPDHTGDISRTIPVRARRESILAL